MLQKFWGHYGNIEKIFWKFWEYFAEILKNFYKIYDKRRQGFVKFKENLTEILGKFCENF